MGCPLLDLWCLYGRLKRRRGLTQGDRESLLALCLAASAAVRGETGRSGLETARAALKAVLDALDAAGVAQADVAAIVNTHARVTVRPAALERADA